MASQSVDDSVAPATSPKEVVEPEVKPPAPKRPRRSNAKAKLGGEPQPVDEPQPQPVGVDGSQSQGTSSQVVDGSQSQLVVDGSQSQPVDGSQPPKTPRSQPEQKRKPLSRKKQMESLALEEADKENDVVVVNDNAGLLAQSS